MITRPTINVWEIYPNRMDGYYKIEPEHYFESKELGRRWIVYIMHENDKTFCFYFYSISNFQLGLMHRV